MSDGAMCACRRVDAFEKRNEDGSCSGGWICRDCGNAFMPVKAHEYALAAAEERAAKLQRQLDAAVIRIDERAKEADVQTVTLERMRGALELAKADLEFRPDATHQECCAANVRAFERIHRALKDAPTSAREALLRATREYEPPLLMQMDKDDASELAGEIRLDRAHLLGRIKTEACAPSEDLRREDVGDRL